MLIIVGASASHIKIYIPGSVSVTVVSIDGESVSGVPVLLGGLGVTA